MDQFLAHFCIIPTSHACMKNKLIDQPSLIETTMTPNTNFFLSSIIIKLYHLYIIILRSLVREMIIMLESIQQVHYNIGKIRAEKGQVVIAEKFYREAIRYVGHEVTDGLGD